MRSHSQLRPTHSESYPKKVLLRKISPRYLENPLYQDSIKHDQLSTHIESLTKRQKNPQNRDSPIPLKFSRDKSPPKENIFKNPSACYLSRKQLSFNKPTQESLPTSSPDRFQTPIKLKNHAKNNSELIVSSDQNSHKRLPVSLVPIDSLKKISPILRKNQSGYMKAAQCDALSSIAQYCDSSMVNCSKISKYKRSMMAKYAKDINWLASITKVYAQYEPNIAKELISFSDHTKKEFDKEREKIVSLIKSGEFDPNINTIKLKALRKKPQNH